MVDCKKIKDITELTIYYRSFCLAPVQARVQLFCSVYEAGGLNLIPEYIGGIRSTYFFYTTKRGTVATNFAAFDLDGNQELKLFN